MKFTQSHQRFTPLMTAISLLFLSLVTPLCASADNLYRVNASIYHLGELIGNPEMDVIAGTTRGGTFKSPDNSQYRFIVLVREQTNDDLYVSLQFSAGKIDIQPDLMVKKGEEVSATIDKVRLTLVVRAIEEINAGEAIASNDR